MKTPIFVTAFLLIVPTIVAAQTPTRDRRSSETEQSVRVSNTMRDRVVGPKAPNHAAAQKASEAAMPTPSPEPSSSPTWGNTAFIVRPSRTTSNRSATPNPTTETDQQKASRKLVQPTSLVASAKPENGNARVVPAARTLAPTSTYNVGIGDVLDVRLANVATRESTLFTVQRNGTLEYPLLNGPVAVVGLSTDEISRLLSAEIRVIKSPRIIVSVRDYASHSVVIGGLVASPGRKVLRREAMPLFAILAEALARPEATTAIILRNGKEGQALSLKDEQAMSTLVLPGDVIKISGAQATEKRFLYVGGAVTSPGEKTFRDGMTLTQAVLSAGGVSSSGKAIIKIARRNSSGFLSTSEYNLRAIEDGKVLDPLLEAGDRIEVTRM